MTTSVETPRRRGWLEERLGLASIREFIAHKTVPQHSHTMWYYFGGITLFLFVIQVLTGTLLLLYYRPSPAEAYESVQFIMTRVSFGWLIRSIHSWSANLMILSAMIHMFSVVFLRAYRRPHPVSLELRPPAGLLLVRLSQVWMQREWPWVSPVLWAVVPAQPSEHPELRRLQGGSGVE